MKKILISMVILVSALTCGCSSSRELIKASSVSTRSDVFRDVANGSPIPRGYADLQVVSSLKTHKQGIYPFENDAHGTSNYLLVLNIDGQTVQMKGTLTEENCEPRRLRDPEAGDGIRYSFRKVIRLKNGIHKVIIASPDEAIAVAGEINLAGGSSNTLMLEPIYGTTAGGQGPGFYGSTSFHGGIKGFWMIFNGKSL